MQTLKLKQPATNKVKQGRALLVAADFLTALPALDGRTVRLADTNGHFVASAYLAPQHKGVGWVYSRQDETLSEAFFVHLFEQAKERRQALIADNTTTGYRLFNGDGDGFGGVIIDWYNGYAAIHWYSEAVLRYQDAIISAFQAVFSDCRGIVAKYRFKSDHYPKSQWLTETHAPADWSITENGIPYVTHLDDGWMTGLFFDQRAVRGMLTTELAAGKRVLNTFSYAGAFSIAAAMGGAMETVSVDIAKRTPALIQEQLALNGLDAAQHHIYVMDTFAYFDYAERHDERFDVVILDPPSFAHVGKHNFKVTRDYADLVARALALLNPGGVLIASTNAADFARAAFQQAIFTGAKQARRTLQVMRRFALPEPDFPVPPETPESDYLKVFILSDTARS